MQVLKKLHDLKLYDIFSKLDFVRTKYDDFHNKHFENNFTLKYIH